MLKPQKNFLVIKVNFLCRFTYQIRKIKLIIFKKDRLKKAYFLMLICLRISLFFLFRNFEAYKRDV